ncbi:hypothetical protein RF11_01969 [Thelohanellus kitauei]|uniref:Uncharacterized protein n=1 Tax=Thelohanellus kitauei TaxID=669202 RepID=A0A0C2JFC8_THEKT|nr:hypothetical protein RF11_01969 [Thelohanellus kitauei]
MVTTASYFGCLLLPIAVDFFFVFCSFLRLWCQILKISIYYKAKESESYAFGSNYRNMTLHTKKSRRTLRNICGRGWSNFNLSFMAHQQEDLAQFWLLPLVPDSFHHEN